MRCHPPPRLLTACPSLSRCGGLSPQWTTWTPTSRVTSRASAHPCTRLPRRALWRSAMCCYRSAWAPPGTTAPHPTPPQPLPGANRPSMQAGANINAVDKQQRTPLMEAVVNNHLEVARYMVQRGGCVYSKVRGHTGPGRAQGPGLRCQPEDSSARISPRRKTAPPASTTPPKLGTWRWSACC